MKLPAEILDRVHAGQDLSDDEQRLYDSHPLVARDLLTHIPRLEGVGAMIVNQSPTVAQSPVVAGAATVEALLGGQILQIALMLERAEREGLRRDEGIARARQSLSQVKPRLWDGVKDLPWGGRPTVVRTVRARELLVGMALDEDVVTASGTLMLARDHELSVTAITLLQNSARARGLKEPFRVRVRA